MSDSISRLSAALEGRKSIERELGLGVGGMARVYLSEPKLVEAREVPKVLGASTQVTQSGCRE